MGLNRWLETAKESIQLDPESMNSLAKGASQRTCSVGLQCAHMHVC